MKEQIVAIVAEYKGVDPKDIRTDVSFKELELDSLDVAELMGKIEDELGIAVDPTPDIDTIDKLVALLEQ